MFGCGLPVCALNFKWCAKHSYQSPILNCLCDLASLDELVKDGRNGLVFNNAEQLASQLEVRLLLIAANMFTKALLQSLLASFPNNRALATLRSSLIHPSNDSTSWHSYHGLDHKEGIEWEWSNWTENWDRVVKPLLVDSFES